MYIFVFLCFFNEIINILSEPLILKFTTRKIGSDDYMKTLINNDIYTYFFVGSNKQQMEMNIKSQKSSTFLVPESCPDNSKAKKFNEKNSDSYNVSYPQHQYYMYEFKEGTLATDNLILLQNNNKEIEIKDFTFILANKLWDSYQEYMGGMLGLKLTTKEDEELKLPEQSSFINQLKIRNIINSYVFALDYKDDFNGNLYVGDYFHNFNKNFSKDDFFTMKAGSENFKVKNWDINIEKIICGNNIIQNKTYLQIYYEYGIIAAPTSFKVYMNDTFFKDYLKNGICEEKLNLENIASFKKYIYVVCDKNKFDKKSFPRLKFYNAEIDMNFTLGYEDLFTEYQDKVYFLIIYPIYGLTVEYWLIGKPFIKKYKLFLDKDEKTIGIYMNYTEIKEEQEKDALMNANYTGYIVIIVILVLVLIVSIISILYYFLVLKKSRRIRANELDDNTDYIIHDGDKEGDKNQFIIN